MSTWKHATAKGDQKVLKRGYTMYSLHISILLCQLLRSTHIFKYVKFRTRKLTLTLRTETADCCSTQVTKCSLASPFCNFSLSLTYRYPIKLAKKNQEKILVILRYLPRASCACVCRHISAAVFESARISWRAAFRKQVFPRFGMPPKVHICHKNSSHTLSASNKRIWEVQSAD